MKKLLILGAVVFSLGCEASVPADPGAVMISCAKACQVGESKMSKWNAKDGCVCDTSSHSKPQ